MERTLEETQTTEQDTEAIGQAETSESEETTEVVSEEESLEALLPSLTEKQKAEYATLTKKAKDFDGLAAKRNLVKPKETRVNVTEDSIRAVLHKDAEKKALKDSIDPSSPNFIPELVSDANFSKIVAYLPRSIDRSSPETIHKALKLATRMWKEDSGTKEQKEKPEAELSQMRGTGSGGERGEAVKTGERKLIKKQSGIESWYAKE